METEIALETTRFRQNGRGRPARNLVGLHYGRLTVRGALRQKGGRTWLCECECGNRVEVSGIALRAGKRSCGCLKWRSNGVITRPLAIWSAPPPANDNAVDAEFEDVPMVSNRRYAPAVEIRPWWRRLLDVFQS